jgi:hypothetical protein
LYCAKATFEKVAKINAAAKKGTRFLRNIPSSKTVSG